MQVYVWNVSSYFSLNEEDAHWKNSLALIEEERRTKLEKYRNPKDKARSLAAGLLLRYGFLQFIEKKESRNTRKDDFTDSICRKNICKDNNLTDNICKKNICIDNNFAENVCMEKILTGYHTGENYLMEYNLSCGEGLHEKPYFLHYPDIHFNLSHSGDYVALVIGEQPCGIDIQEPRTLSEGFRRKFYHEEEKEWLVNHPRDEIRIFSMKEAVMKYTGEGLSKGMSDFSVVPLLLKKEIREMDQHVFGDSMRLANDYALSVVTTGDIGSKLLDSAIYLESMDNLKGMDN